MRAVWKVIAVVLLLCAEWCAYGNHFHNGFHFDDSHTVVDNPAIRSLSNLPRFFNDTSTFSVLPANRTYRPFVTTTLALDYALGHGYSPFWFQLSTFLVFLALLVAMLFLFDAILASAAHGRSPRTFALALFATAVYGLHPAMAETVNYIIQRGDVYCAFGVVVALALYACSPAWRRTGLYLLPFAFALLSKPPAIVFPLLLALYVLLFARPAQASRQARAWQLMQTVLPALLVCILLLALQAHMTPRSYTPSTLSTSSYVLTQPYVLLRYFGSFYLPLHLNVDTDLHPFAAWNLQAVLGCMFLFLLVATAALCAKSARLRPIAFGLSWFLISSLPTSLYKLSEVENDHRMFLPFVGLTLATAWAAGLALDWIMARMPSRNTVAAATALALLILTVAGCGVWQRNRVWHSDESLWLDDVQKSPRNGRGWMNYGLTLMARGDYSGALAAFQRALPLTPNYPSLEINLGIVLGQLNRAQQAESHFLRAIALAPADDQTHFYYARWLYLNGQAQQALPELQRAAQLNPSRSATLDLLASAHAALGDAAAARAVASNALSLDTKDALAQQVLADPVTQGTNFWIEQSLSRYRQTDYADAILAARRALALNPRAAVAYINLGAALAGLHRYGEAIESEQQALRLQPDSTLARNNLALYQQLNAASTQTPSASNTSPDDWLNASLDAYARGAFTLCITDARKAIALRPGFAEAYNNMAAAYASMKQWDLAIGTAQQALQLKPDFQLARNNLAWAQKGKSGLIH